MSNSRIKHALIVTGPSGAGKSTFLRALANRRLSPEICGHLPAGAETWRSICSINQQQDWQALIANGAEPVAGVAVHYDMTSMWFCHQPDFTQDPFWQILDHCAAVTLITIHPPQKRLVEQWRHEHLCGRRGWHLRWKELCATGSALTIRVIRKLRKRAGNDARRRWRYPRKLRFLKRIDLKLRTIKRPSEAFLDFYQGQTNIETMLSQWEQTIVARMSALPVKRVHLAPDPKARIGGSPAWRVIEVEEQIERAAIRPSGHQQRAGIGANLVAATLLGAIERSIGQFYQFIA